MQHHPQSQPERPKRTEPDHPLRPGRRRTRGAAIAATIAAASLTTVAGGDTASATMTGEAKVECNSSYNTIEVTPQVVSDWPDTDQWTATKVWIAHWTGSSWTWTSSDWKIELASKTNTPVGAPIADLDTRLLERSDGHYYVYVHSFMWDGARWNGGTGEYTRTYTQVTPSVSQEPDTRTTSTYCTL